ncbi:hypothetical protein [Nocardioides aquiterrae]|uniref:Uncharacterized protein n=1 Tax=Nocardioides aquiterrae TaxID=203799 RepID=A0ABN1UA22_9ACTN
MNDLHALMDRALADLDVPTDRLHAGAVRRGRAARRRRRAGVVLGGVAAAVAVAVAVPLLGTVGASTGDQLAQGGAVLPPPDVYEPAPHWWTMPGEEVAHRLTFLTPSRYTTPWTFTGASRAWAELGLKDDHGYAGLVNVELRAPADAGGDAADPWITCPGNLTAPDSCTEVHGASGAVVGRDSRTTDGDEIVLESTYLTPDGAVVRATSSNSTAATWGGNVPTMRDHAPMTLAEVRDVAEARLWQQRWPDE